MRVRSGLAIARIELLKVGLAEKKDEKVNRFLKRHIAICAAIAALGAGGAAQPRGLALEGRTKIVDLTAREPMIVQHRSGALFVCGYGRNKSEFNRPPKLWKSSDGGDHWSRVSVGTVEQGAVGNSDCDLATDRKNGALYFANLVFDREQMRGTRLAVGASDDAGATWRWTTLSRQEYVDRPWVAVSPDGAAHVIWNDASGIYYSSSKDRGRKWSEPKRIAEAGASSHLAAGPHGRIAVRVVPVSAYERFSPGADFVLVSTDSGKTWKKCAVPGERDWAHSQPAASHIPIPRWVEPLAWDETGALYLLWTEYSGVWLARSRDDGNSWQQWQIDPASERAYYPYLVAHGKALAMTWASGFEEKLRLNVATAEVTPSQTSVLVAHSEPQEIEAWQPPDKPEGSATRDTAGEYFGVAFLRDGSLGVVTPIQFADGRDGGFTFWRYRPKNDVTGVSPSDSRNTRTKPPTR